MSPADQSGTLSEQLYFDSFCRSQIIDITGRFSFGTELSGEHVILKAHAFHYAHHGFQTRLLVRLVKVAIASMTGAVSMS